MKEQLQQLEEQKKRARDALNEIEGTIDEIKQSTGYKIHSMIEKDDLKGIKQISPKHDGTHIIFENNELNKDTLDKFKRFKLKRLYSENSKMIAVFE
jgi:hypothetical protein